MMTLGPATLVMALAFSHSLPEGTSAVSNLGDAQLIRVAADAEAETPADPALLPGEGEAAPAEGDAATNAVTPAGGDVSGDAVAATAAPEPAQCETPEDMLLLIAREREQIAVQKADAEAKIAEAALASEALNAEIARLEALKKEIDSFAAARSEAQQEELERLVKVYETMKAKEAAALLEEMDMGTTMELFGLMKERKAASILGAMNPVRARAISRILVEMAKLPGDRDLSGIRIK